MYDLFTYLCELQVESGGVDAMKVPNERKRPRSRGEVCRHFVLQNISQQQKNTQKYQNTFAVHPLQAEDTKYCLYYLHVLDSSMPYGLFFLMIWAALSPHNKSAVM